MKALAAWVAAHGPELDRAAQSAASPSGGGVHVPDDKVAAACFDVVGRLAPQQQRTILALAQQLAETHPQTGEGGGTVKLPAPSAGNVKLDR